MMPVIGLLLFFITFPIQLCFAEQAANNLVLPTPFKINLSGEYLATVARSYIEEKKFDEALLYYYQALKNDPYNPDLLIEVARVEGWKKNYPKAIELLQRVLQVAPQRRMDVLRPLGWQYADSGHPEKAMPLFNEYLTKYPKDENALRGLAYSQNLLNAALLTQARNYYYKKQYALALTFYYQALNNAPNNTDLLIEIGRVESEANHYQKAIELFQKVILIAPARKLDVFRPLGWLYAQIGKPQEAMRYFQGYLNVYPHDQDALKGIVYTSSLIIKNELKNARELVQKKDYSQALKIYYYVLARYPNNTDLLIEIARVEGYAKNHKQAIELLQKVLKINPARRSDVVRDLASHYLANNQKDKATPLYKEYVKQHPKDKEAEKGLLSAKGILLNGEIIKAREFVAKKDYAKAVIYYYKVLEKKPNDTDVLIETARVEGYLKHHDKAITLLLKVISVDPKRRIDVLRPLGWQYAEKGEPQNAEPYFTEYLKSHPNDQDAKKGLAYAKAEIENEDLRKARVLVEQKKNNLALPYYYKALKKDPKNTDLLIETARVEGYEKHHKEAIALLEKVIKLTPSRRFDVLRPLAWQYAENGDAKKATILFKEYLKKTPKDKDALAGLEFASVNKEKLLIKQAREYLDKKEFEKALTLYHKMLQKKPNDADLLIETARVEGYAKHPANAIRLLEKVIAVAPKRRLDVLRPLAWQYAEEGKYDQAITFFNEYLKKHPEDADATEGIAYAKEGIQAAILKKARAFTEKKQYHEALTCYYQALKNKPTDADLLIETARVEGYNKNPYQAISLLEKVLIIAPKRRLDVLRPLGWQYSDVKQFAKAAALFTEYLAKFPKDQDANKGWYSTTLDLARQLNDQKRYQEALGFYARVYNKKHDIDILIEMAKVHGNADENEAAIAIYRKVMCIAPAKREQVMKPLAWQLIWSGSKTGESLYLFKSYLCKHPKDVDAKLGIARFYESIDEYRVALCAYRQIQKCHPDNYDARYGEARAQLNLDRFATAERLYWKIFFEKPKDTAAREGIALSHSWGRKPILAANEFAMLIRYGHRSNSNYINLAQSLRWAGFSDWALYALNHLPPDKNYPCELKQLLLRDLGHPVTIDYLFSKDSDTLVINAYQVTAGYRFQCTPTVFGPGYRYINLREFGERILGEEGWFFVTTRIGSFDNLMGAHFLFLAIGERGYQDWRTFAWRFTDRWEVTDYLKINFEARNEAIENIPSIQNRILFKSASTIVDLWPYARVLIRNGGTYGEFSDGNIRKRMINRVEWTIFFHPRIVVGYNDRYFNDTRPELNSGYYNPADYFEWKGMIYLEEYYGDWTFSFLGEQGKFMEKPGSKGPLNNYEGAIVWDLKRYGVLRAYFGYSKSSPALNAPNQGPIGYWRRYYGISYFLGINTGSQNCASCFPLDRVFAPDASSTAATANNNATTIFTNPSEHERFRARVRF